MFVTKLELQQITLKRAAGDRLPLRLVTSTPPTRHVGNQLYLAVLCSGKTLKLCHCGLSRHWLDASTSPTYEKTL